jgi:hypothetical protein
MSPELVAQIADTLQTLAFLGLCGFITWMILK